eukprot:CAMPEP_0184368678 /NCGR_PEP_ID=MMETSP1089-20130417/161809_1 /TAXON_ID=38269 ORGANISM="Gloeochaete wittrockiana, Strain SAG46.84" /NCGR_SAMPLE_ID=MMETSP1089 /ASSEMBLY_ACC=CAM_ASM_000445 /LENGTH=404 /DNA_ID=CAMNT_0026711011 /DNA_START=78 /DNA_END=1289 /DNA_ORIENTATION=+
MSFSRRSPALLALIVVLGLICSADALYSEKSDVIKLTKDNFAELVLNSDHVWLVEFYAPWCGHCKSLAPAWDTAATNLKGIVKVGAVNGDEERELAGLYQIKGFPTIKLFPSEKKIKKGGVADKTPVDYNGARSAPAIVNFAHSSLPNFVSSSDISTFLKTESELNKVILFSSKSTISPLFKGLAIEFKDRILFAQASNSDATAVADFGVTDFPTLFVLKADGEKIKFGGKIKADEILKFLTPFAPAPAKSNTKSKSSSSSSSSSQAPPEVRELKFIANQEALQTEWSSSSSSSSSQAPPEVRELKFIANQEALQTECYAKHGTCAIAFLDPNAEDHSTLIETLTGLVEKEKSFRFFWVDGTKNLKFADAVGVANSFPQFAVINPSKKLAGSMTSYFSADKISA